MRKNLYATSDDKESGDWTLVGVSISGSVLLLTLYAACLMTFPAEPYPLKQPPNGWHAYRLNVNYEMSRVRFARRISTTSGFPSDFCVNGFGNGDTLLWSQNSVNGWEMLK